MLVAESHGLRDRRRTPPPQAALHRGRVTVDVEAHDLVAVLGVRDPQPGQGAQILSTDRPYSSRPRVIPLQLVPSHPMSLP